MNILCLAPEDSSWKMLPFYASAFRKRGIEIHFLDWSLPLNTSLDAILSSLTFTPDYLFSPECGFPFLPDDIAQSRIPTIRLDVDTYTFTRRRIRWASLFDHVAVCHPGFDALFREKYFAPGDSGSRSCCPSSVFRAAGHSSRVRYRLGRADLWSDLSKARGMASQTRFHLSHQRLVCTPTPSRKSPTFLAALESSSISPATIIPRTPICGPSKPSLPAPYSSLLFPASLPRSDLFLAGILLPIITSPRFSLLSVAISTMRIPAFASRKRARPLFCENTPTIIEWTLFSATCSSSDRRNLRRQVTGPIHAGDSYCSTITQDTASCRAQYPSFAVLSGVASPALLRASYFSPAFG